MLPEYISCLNTFLQSSRGRWIAVATLPVDAGPAAVCCNLQTTRTQGHYIIFEFFWLDALPSILAIHTGRRLQFIYGQTYLLGDQA